MDTEQYDGIADAYRKVNQSPIHLYSVVPTVAALVGDVRGLVTADVACGNGFFSRWLCERGTARVAGTDISRRQIELAREEPLSDRIDYRVLSATDVGRTYGPIFDLALCAFLFHYAATENELLRMARSLHAALKPGGRLVGIGHNPKVTYFEDVRYRRRFRRERSGAPLDGEALVLEIYGEEGLICEFGCYHWSVAAYERAFADAGFKSLRWLPMQVDPRGVERCGSDFWDAYRANPHLVGFTAWA